MTATFAKRQKMRRQQPDTAAKSAPPNVEADWTGKCEVCGASPVVPETGMCGPCTFGEADTAGGNW